MVPVMYEAAVVITQGAAPKRHSRLSVLHWIVQRMQTRPR